MPIPDLRAAHGDGEARLGSNLIGDSTAFREVLSTVKRLARCKATVLITGETGTGKEVAARAIHYSSDRATGPFIALNCGAIPDALVESELFGHVRGAFTDAKETRHGVISHARGGTLFLDEIEAISPRAQVALLRFLQDHQYQPVGGHAAQSADVRVIAATNCDLQPLAHAGAFRRDLLFRLDVLPLRLPPLRTRDDDVILLARHFLQEIARTHGTSERALSAQALTALREHDWPGNVRELQNVLLREVLLTDQTVLELASLGAAPCAADGTPSQIDLTKGFRAAKLEVIEAFEKAYLTELLARTRGNVSQAARIAGKERSRLTKLVKKHGIQRAEYAD